MSVKGNKSKDASQETAETVEAKVAPVEFAMPSNAIKAPLVLNGHVGDVLTHKVDGKMVPKTKQNGEPMKRNKLPFSGHALGVEVTVYADPEAMKDGQEYDVFIVPRQA
jgi:hypothetical protein